MHTVPRFKMPTRSRVLGAALAAWLMAGAAPAAANHRDGPEHGLGAAGLNAEHTMIAWLRGALGSAHSLTEDATERALQVVVPLMTHPVLVEETARQNALRVPLSVVRQRDREWIEADGLTPLQVEVSSNACARALVAALDGHADVAEAFVMDDQGALVCATVVTSDYWQGDEAKWTQAYNGGQGGVDIGAAQFDASAGVVLRQVSLPLLRGGRAIGALTIGLRIER